MLGLPSVNELKKQNAKEEMLSFAKYVKPNYIDNWHHKLLCKYLDDFANGKIKRLMVFLPPQHGKSELTSRMLPAYLLGRNPEEKIVLASYSATWAESFNRDCQKYIDSDEYKQLFPATTLVSGSNGGGKYVRNNERFDVVGHGGFLKTVGVGGSLTGTAADTIIIDDPVKDKQEAKSAITQLRNWEWYLSVAETRIHNGSKILIIQTRWDTNDLSGKLLQYMNEGEDEDEKDNKEQWTILTLPAIKEDDNNPEDPRKIGEALWPSRHSLQRLERIRAKSKGIFESLYQQNPQPVQSGGEAYKTFTYEANTRDNKYNPDLALHVTFDFNVHPYMTCGVWQVEKGTDVIGNKYYNAYKIAEICLKSPRNTSKSVCYALNSKYAGHKMGMYIYGDPHGMDEDTRSEKGHNDYLVIRTELKQFNPQLRVMTKAPHVKTRIDFMNALFSGGYEGLKIWIGRDCYRTIEDYQYLKEDVDGTKLKEKQIDPHTGVNCERYGHTSDSDEYFLTAAFANIYAVYQNGGRSAAPRLGQRKTNWYS